jgi:hypothetical protein
MPIRPWPLQPDDSRRPPQRKRDWGERSHQVLSGLAEGAGGALLIWQEESTFLSPPVNDPSEPARIHCVMKTRLFQWWWPAWLILPALAVAEPPDAARARARIEVEAVARELVAGIAASDWAPWERHAADDLLYTTELGRTLTKQELKGVFRPPDPGSQRPLTLVVVGFQSRGEAAVIAFELVAREPEGVERYRVTQTYWRIGGRWRLVASQACGVADDSDPPSLERGAR